RGERGEERELLRLAELAGGGAAIDYRGWVEPQRISGPSRGREIGGSRVCVEPHASPALLAAADIALAPMDDTLINRARGLAKLLELMAAGLPIVAGPGWPGGADIQEGPRRVTQDPEEPR